VNHTSVELYLADHGETDLRGQALDTTGDGRIDARDTTGDGTIDAVDTTGDGKMNAFDTTGDGNADTFDTTGDGHADAWDTTGDGKIDTVADAVLGLRKLDGPASGGPANAADMAARKWLSKTRPLSTIVDTPVGAEPPSNESAANAALSASRGRVSMLGDAAGVDEGDESPRSRHGKRRKAEGGLKDWREMLPYDQLEHIGPDGQFIVKGEVGFGKLLGTLFRCRPTHALVPRQTSCHRMNAPLIEPAGCVRKMPSWPRSWANVSLSISIAVLLGLHVCVYTFYMYVCRKYTLVYIGPHTFIRV
jgi:hypothetical protein